jgi:WD40 repeat protein
MKKQINTLISLFFISVLFSNVFADTIREPIRTFYVHTSSAYSVAFSPDGRYALSGSHDGTLKLWDVNSGAEIRTFAMHTDSVVSVAFFPDGRYCLAVGITRSSYGM